MYAEPGPPLKKKRLEDEETASSASDDTAGTGGQSKAFLNRLGLDTYAQFYWFGFLPSQVLTLHVFTVKS